MMFWPRCGLQNIMFGETGGWELKGKELDERKWSREEKKWDRKEERR